MAHGPICIAGPAGSLAVGTSVADSDRQARRAPLLRFCPLQRLPATLRCPVSPSLGRSRSGRSDVRAVVSHAMITTLACSSAPLRFFAWRLVEIHRGLFQAPLDPGHASPFALVQAMFRYPRSRLRGLVDPAPSRISIRIDSAPGVRPSQSSSRLRVSAVSPRRRAHLPFHQTSASAI